MAESMNNFIGNCVQSIVCKALHTSLSESLLTKTHIFVFGYDNFTKCSITVCNQSYGTGKKNEKNVYFEKIGYTVFEKH